jgi:hypothetical protein
VKTINRCALVLILLLAGCLENYPGGLSEQEWAALSPDRKADLRMRQDQLDEQRRENNNRETARQDEFARVDQLTRREDMEREAVHSRDDSNEAIPGWTYLGRADSVFQRDHAGFELGRAYGRFRELKFIVRGGELDLYNMTVFVGDTEAISPNVRGHYERDTACRTIHFPGGERTIVRIDFDFRSSAHRHGKATVFVYAK